MKRMDPLLDLARKTKDMLEGIPDQVKDWTPDMMEADIRRCLNLKDPLDNGIGREYYLTRAERVKAIKEARR